MDGFRRILGVCEGEKEDKAGWLDFLKHLKKRGLKGLRLVVSDACLGLVEALGETFPDADWQRDVMKMLRTMKLRKAAELVEAHIDETLSYYAYPPTGAHEST